MDGISGTLHSTLVLVSFDSFLYFLLTLILNFMIGPLLVLQAFADDAVDRPKIKRTPYIL